MILSRRSRASANSLESSIKRFWSVSCVASSAISCQERLPSVDMMLLSAGGRNLPAHDTAKIATGKYARERQKASSWAEGAQIVSDRDDRWLGEPPEQGG